MRWEGNLQLIGYIDVIFLISYQGTARFQDGIVIYSEFLPLQSKGLSLCRVIDAVPSCYQLEDEKDPHLMVEGQVIKAPGDTRIQDKAQEKGAFQRTKSDEKVPKPKEKVKPESMI